jgi:hypothetical protein
VLHVKDLWLTETMWITQQHYFFTECLWLTKTLSSELRFKTPEKMMLDKYNSVLGYLQRDCRFSVTYLVCHPNHPNPKIYRLG